MAVRLSRYLAPGNEGLNACWRCRHYLEDSMRKLLLATVAILSTGMCIAEDAQAQAFPKPGTVTVRLNGRFRFYAGLYNDSDAQNNLQGPPTATGVQTGSNKLANYGFDEYARLYPGFDGVAANGLKYGASLEIRQDNVRGAGGGIYGSPSGQSRDRGSLYYRRAWGYLGTNKVGTVRFGSTDQPSSLYMTGNFENFNSGGWNGDDYQQLAQNTVPTWPFADVGNMYTTNKVVYLSPQLFGFDFGVSFEPSTANLNISSSCGASGTTGTNFVTPAGGLTVTSAGTLTGGSASTPTVIGLAGANGQSIAGPGCDRLSSTPTGDYARRRNTFDGLLRYRGVFGGFGVAATGGYIGGSRVLDSSTPARSAQFDGLSIGDFGVALTYAGLSVGGKYQVGRVNGQWSLDPRNGTPGEAWLVGTSYTFGPVIVGASYFEYKSTGDLTQTLSGRQRLETGLNVGGTYSLAPGVALFAEYLYGQRRQHGFNFITNTTNDFTNHNKVTSSVISLGTALSW